MKNRFPVPLIFCLLLAACRAPVAKESVAPEAASGRIEKPAVRARKMMVVSANPLASEAGLEILRRGGSAVDAAIAAQAVLNIVEPQSSGIGGGGFLLHHDAAAKKTSAYDGRETAPREIRDDIFLDADGKPLEFYAALLGGRSVGVPGVLKMLETAHKKHGKLPWADLFAEAVSLAENGFPISPRLNAAIAATPNLNTFEPARRLLFEPDGVTPKPVGALLKNPELARTLRLIASGGTEVFYRGEIARDIVAAVRGAPKNPGALDERDLASYEARERAPLCRPFRAFTVCGMPPPTSGGTAVLQILGILEFFDLRAAPFASADFAHLFTQASRLAFADRDLYLADPDFIDVPVAALLEPAYLRGRAALVSMDKDLSTVPAGRIEPLAAALSAAPDSESPGTSHLSVVDASGNAVAFTTSIENGFGSTLMARGFFLNNTLTDFSFEPRPGGKPSANRIEPGKRPRSSMAPTLAFRTSDGALVMAAGSPGGARIIDYVAESLLGVLEFGADPQSAVAHAHVANRNAQTELEKGTAAEALRAALAAKGHETAVVDLNSGSHIIARQPDGSLVGGADPRREGLAAGE